MGSRQHGVYLRVYDKAAEQKAKGVACDRDAWVRWEFELRDDRAESLVNYIVDGIQLGTLFYGLLNNYVRLINLDNSNVSRCSLLPEWADFTESVRPLRLYCPPAEKTYYEKTNWIESQVMPTLAGVVMLDGYEWIEKHMDESIRRMSKPMKEIVESELQRRFEREQKLGYVSIPV